MIGLRGRRGVTALACAALAVAPAVPAQARGASSGGASGGSSGGPSGGSQRTVTYDRARTIVDTRSGTGAAKGRLRDGRAVHVRVRGTGGVPKSAVTAVRLRISLVDALHSGNLTITDASGDDLHVIHVENRKTARITTNFEMPRGGVLVARDQSRARFHLVVQVLGYTAATD